MIFVLVSKAPEAVIELLIQVIVEDVLRESLWDLGLLLFFQFTPLIQNFVKRLKKLFVPREHHVDRVVIASEYVPELFYKKVIPWLILESVRIRLLQQGCEHFGLRAGAHLFWRGPELVLFYFFVNYLEILIVRICFDPLFFVVPQKDQCQYNLYDVISPTEVVASELIHARKYHISIKLVVLCVLNMSASGLISE